MFIGHKLMGCHRGQAKCGFKKRQELEDQRGADQMDDRVKGYIRALVQQGVRKVKEVKNQMVQYVWTELFRDTTPPPLRRFFPTEKTILAIMAQVIAEEHYSNIDLVNLLKET
ncbi:uncharacterized protein ACWYII_033574 [Salvelinus alpinus]